MSRSSSPQVDDCRCASKCVVVHVGPDRRMAGGVASVLRSLSTSALGDRFDLRFISTIDGSGTPKVWVVARAVGAFVRDLRSGAVLVHLHTASRGSFWRKYLLSRLAVLHRVEYVVHIHGGGFAAFAKSGRPMRSRAVRGFLRDAGAVLVLNRATAEVLGQVCGSCSPIIVRNPVETREDASIAGSREQVLFLGRLVRLKGIYDLLAAIDHLQHIGCEWRWFLVGECVEAQVIDHLVGALPRPELVEITGEVTPDHVKRYLNESGIFCLPSYVEGQPVSLLEAMASGLACVATPVGGVPDLIVDRQTGRLVEPEDPVGLATVLEELIRSPLERRRLGDAARKMVESEYAVEHVVNALLSIYDELLQGGPCDSSTPRSV